MKKNLSFKETITITSMLFGMFFGAGNLIFPIYMGQAAGSNVMKAIIGFLITGVGLPILAVAALGISKTNGLKELSEKVGGKYSMFFTCLLYLTIGPLFAIPRCATVPFSVGVTPMLGGASETAALLLFTVIFFAVVLFFSLRPGGILTWIGKILNPIFLITLGILVLTALFRPIGEIKNIIPESDYAAAPLFKGFIEGYNTMDTLAGLAFGIVVVNVIRGLGIENPDDIAKNTVRAGVFSGIIMAVIYFAVTIVGTESRGLYPTSANGGEAFHVVANHYFGTAGALILAVIITFACLKTAIGLITSCSEAFEMMFPNGPKYNTWAIIFCLFSCFVGNLGLTLIITYSLPVLMFLYPLAISLILLSLCDKLFGGSKCVYISVTALTLAAAVLDFIKALPADAISFLHLGGVIKLAEIYLPFFKIGLGWICPAAAGLFIGIILKFTLKKAE